MRAVAYTRVSSDQAHGRSVAEQEKEIRADVARQGWVMHEPVLCDNDRGASRHSRGQRPAYEQLKEILRPGDVLVTWEASRAQRDLAAYVKLRELCAERGVLWRYSGTTHDLSTGEGRFRTGLDALLSENESEKTRERVLRAQRADAAAGKPHGKIAYGYKAERDPETGKVTARVIDETRAPIVREIARRILAGEAIRSIVRDLNRREVPAPGKAKEWVPVSTAQMIQRPTLAGLRAHRGAITPGVWEPIISVEDHQKVVALLSNPARKTHRGVEPRWLLTGIAVCAVCSERVVVLSNRGYPAYTCPDKSRHVSRVVSGADEFVVESILRRLESPDVLEGIAEDDVVAAEAMAEVSALRARLEAFTDSAAEGELSPAALARVEQKLVPQIAAAERRVQASFSSPLVAKLAGPDALDGWLGLDVIERRTVVRALASVRILRASRGRNFDPESIQITWL